MKTILVLFLIYCTEVVDINCESIVEEMDAAFDFCLKEYDITVDEFSSTKVDLTCFNTCVAIKAGIIKDKMFNMEKYANYLLAKGDPDNAKEEIKAYEYCVKRMLDIQDECESHKQLEKCVDKQLYYYYKKK